MSGWSFACPDWRARLYAGRSLVPALPLDDAAARRAVGVFNNLRLPDVQGLPKLKDVGGDWFRDIVRAVFGSHDRVTGIRRVPGVFCLVPKKNSKTTNGAALMMTGLLLNERPDAPFGLFGPTQKITDRAYEAAVGMIEADAALKGMLRTRDHLKTIEHRTMGATLKVTTFDPAVATGGKLAGWLLDELHLLGRSPYAAKVLGDLRGARIAIPEQFGVIITTQSTEPPAGVFATELTYARDVRDGKIARPTVLPVLYEFPEDVQADKEKPWRDPALWGLVNPNMGRSVSRAILEQLYEEDEAKGEEEIRRWASQHLNLQIGVALRANGWEAAEFWEAATDPDLRELDDLLARCEVAVVAIDGGGLDDLLGVAVMGRERGTDRWLLWAHAFVNRIALARRKAIAPALEGFERAGELTIVDRPGEDVAGVVEICERVRDSGLFPAKSAIGVDPAGIASIIDALDEVGIGGEGDEGRVVAIAQGYRLNPAIKGLPRKLVEGGLWHGGQGLLAWSVGNAKVEPRGNAVVMEKATAGAGKIDPVIATLMAFQLMAMNPQADVPVRSVYQTRGLRVF